MDATFDVLESIERQAISCNHHGSLLYGALLHGLAGDHRAGGITRDLLTGVTQQPQHDALALRYVATGHLLALAGRAPELSARYQSCGGTWNGEDPTPAFLAVVHREPDEFRAGVRRNVQTNEVGRAAVLAAGFCHIAARVAPLPLRTLEIGASAGLLSRWQQFSYDTGASTCGDPLSPLHFGREWFTSPPPPLVNEVRVVEQAASDVDPIDITSPDGDLRIQSFLWPDHVHRLERLRSALAIAHQHPLHVDRADAGEWLQQQLATPPAEPSATVVFHSIVWQYLPAATRAAVKAAFETAGGWATAERPVHWLRMEPATPEHADVRLTTWPGGDQDRLAHVGYHGAEIDWLV